MKEVGRNTDFLKRYFKKNGKYCRDSLAPQASAEERTSTLLKKPLYIICNLSVKKRTFLLSTHLLVVLLQEEQLLLQALDLHLQVGLGQSHLVQDPPQARNVGLHRLTHGQFVLVPATGKQHLLT